MTEEKKLKVGVGLSGGVDSACVALQLLEQGHEVTGFTMVLTEHGDETVAKARRVADKLGIELKTVDLRREFSELVLSPFVSEYASGRTPSPCVVCNARFKFGAMWQAMQAHGCEAMATGHYVRVKRGESGEVELWRGVDATKDQSYFLSQLSREQLSHAVFPLGDKLKQDVKASVARLGLVAPAEGESQDLCFLPDGDYAPFVLARHPELGRRGAIVSLSGQVLGEHAGAFRYTPGQRRGLGLGGGPWYVCRTNIRTNEVVVAQRSEMGCRRLQLSGMNWLQECPAAGEAVRVLAQIRHLMRPCAATIVREDAGMRVVLTFDEPLLAASPGQLAVLYAGERVVASGWIDGVEA